MGEHLGYAFTGLWSILAGVALIDSSVTADWLGVVGVLIGPLFLICSLEFVGRVGDGAGGRRGADAGYVRRLVAVADCGRRGPTRLKVATTAVGHAPAGARYWRAMSQESVELAHRLVEWFNAGDAEALQAHSTEDAEIVPLRAEIEDTVYRGRGGCGLCGRQRGELGGASIRRRGAS